VYKFVGFGLLGFLALLIIPVSSATQSDDPSMYGMATVSLKDESGNILIENQMHNVVVDQGTAFMLNRTFTGGDWSSSTFPGVNGICVSNANSFSVSDSETPTTFNENNIIDTPFKNCNIISSWSTQTTTSISTTSSFLAGTAFDDGTTITGIGVCGVPSSGGPFLDCNSAASTVVLFSVIDIPNTSIGSGSQLDVTYTFNLD